MKAQLVKREDRWDLYLADGSKGASTAENPMGKLSIKNCETIANGYDLDDLAYHFSWGYQSDPKYGGTIDIFKAGFQKALEILGDKKFSEDNMVKMFFLGRESLDKALVTEGEAKSIVQSLQQPEWDVEIEMEDSFDKNEEIYIDEVGKGNYHTHNKKPKLDSNGYLILKQT